MPRFLRGPKSAVIGAGLLFAQLVLLSLQVPLGDRPSLFEKVTFAVLAPAQRGLRAVFHGLGGFWNRYVDLRRVEAQNRALEDEVLRLRQENALLRGGLDLLQDRDSAAAFLRSLDRAFLLANVIGIDASNPYKSVVIDAGAAQGLRADMAVVDREGRLIGRVILPIGVHEATVQLVTDENSAVSVVSDDSQVLGVLAGDGRNARCWMKYVSSSNEALKETEVLRTSGFDKIFPPGLCVGTVQSISGDASLFKRIAVAPFLDFRQINVVAVLTGGRGGE